MPTTTQQVTAISVTSESRHTDFDALFYPKSIAIIGANKNKLGGSKFYFACKAWGYTGQIFLINPKHSELFGIKCYPSLDDPAIQKPVDLTIISVPASGVPDVIRSLNRSKTKFATIYTSGFAEAGNKELDNELRNAIASTDTRFIGPNCLGVMNPYSKVSIYPQIAAVQGNISLIAQSGGNMMRAYLYPSSLGLGFRNCCGIGNMYDVAPDELLNYYRLDDQTKVIGIYMESMVRGRQFLEVAKQTALTKPIIIWKGGQTARGMSAAASHTGGLAGSFDVWKGMAKQHGIMLAPHFEIFADLLMTALIRPITPKNLNVCIMVCGGGIGVEFTDVFESAGFNVVDLKPQTIEALSKVFPAVNTNFKNPLDLGEYGYEPHMFAKALEIVIKDENVGNIVFVREPDRFDIFSELLNIPDFAKATIDAISPVIKTSNKPIICTPSANRDYVEDFKARVEFQKAMFKAGLPLINYVSNIPQVLLQLYNYGKYLVSHN